MEGALQATIEEGQRSGEIGADRDARDLASLLLTTIIGMTVIAKARDQAERSQRAIRAVMSLV